MRGWLHPAVGGALVCVALAMWPTAAAGADAVALAWGQLSGQVVEVGSERPLARARVRCGEYAAESADDGRFTLALPAGEWTCEAAAEGYGARSATASISPADTAAMRLALPSDLRRAETVDVSAPAVEDGATMTMAATEVSAAAGAAENIFRALQTLPGVAGANEYQSRLIVRGGGPDQNLTVMDGVEIHSPFRLDGVMSAFNPETVTDFELTAGAFSARYGDRLSSLLVVRNRTGAPGQRTSGRAALGMTDGNVAVEGVLPGRVRGTWSLAARQTYYDVIAERVVQTNFPGFRDLQLRSALDLSGGRRLTLFVLRGNEWADTVVPPKSVLPRKTPAAGGSSPGPSDPWLDPIGPRDPRLPDEPVVVPPPSRVEPTVSTANTPKAPSPSLTEIVKNLDRFILDSHNDLVAATLDAPLGGRVRSTTVVSLYRNDEDQTLVRKRAIAPLQAERGVGVHDLAARSELNVELGRHAVVAGGEYHNLRTRWDWQIGQLRADDSWSWASPGGPTTWGRGLPSTLDALWHTYRGGLWIEDRMRLGGHGALRAGLRVDHSGLNAETTLSPRLLVTGHLAGARLYVGLGRHYQSPGFEKLVQGDYFYDLDGAVRYADSAPSPAIPASEPPGSSTPPPGVVVPTIEPSSQTVVATGVRALRSARSLHWVGGLETHLLGAATLRVEVYAKEFDRLTVGRLETEAERAARVARYDFPTDLMGSVPQTPQVTRYPVSDGRGRASGVDIFLARAAGSKAHALDGWISYSYGVARRESWGLTFPFDYDRPHSLSLVGNWRARNWLQLSLTGRVASGFPRTPDVRRVSAIDDAADLDGDGNRSELIPRRNNGVLVYETTEADLTQMNSERYPYYARLDARATFWPGGRNGRLLLYLDVMNVLNRRVPIVQVVPILPSIGARLLF